RVSTGSIIINLAHPAPLRPHRHGDRAGRTPGIGVRTASRGPRETAAHGPGPGRTGTPRRAGLTQDGQQTRYSRGPVTGRLPDPQRSYAVLIGASTYHSPELPDLPAVRGNLDALAEMFTDHTLGWLPRGRCIVLPDPTDVRLVYRTLRRYAGLAEDTLLVYFAGHGRTGPHNELYLSMTDTDPDELRV